VSPISATYRPPRDCPVCRHRLEVTQLGCSQCGTGLSGQFESCEFCGLDDVDRDTLRVFLASRGNMKELERHLGVSYPTARARFDDLLGRLGLADQPAASTEPAAAPAARDPRLDTLEALARGDVSIDDARARLDPQSGNVRARGDTD
jgi:hypothetical protein